MTLQRPHVQAKLLRDEELAPEAEVRTELAERSRAVLIALGLFVLAIVAYLPAVRGHFILADERNIAANFALRSWKDGLRVIWLRPTELGSFTPLTHTHFLFEYKLFGPNRPAGYHAINLIVHGVTVALLWTLLRKLAVRGALAAAAIFAVHPVNVATVAWISQQSILLAAMFGLMSMLLLLRRAGITRAPPEDYVGPRLPRGNLPLYALGIAAAILAMLAHPAAVLLPLILQAIIRHKSGRLTQSDVRMLMPLLALGSIAVVAAVFIAKPDLADVVAAARSMGLSALATIVPLNLALPPVADASYLLVMLIVAVIVSLLARVRVVPIVRTVAAATLVLALLVISFVRTPALATSESLWTEALRRNPDSAAAPYELGLIHLRQKDDPTIALKHFAAALRVDPAHRGALLGAGEASERLGDLESAKNRYFQLLAKDSNDADARVRLGGVFHEQRNSSAALAELTRAVELRPDDARAHLLLGLVYHERDEIDAAQQHYHQSIHLNPLDTEARLQLAEIRFYRYADIAAAQELLVRVLEIDPRNFKAYFNASAMQFAAAKEQTDRQKQVQMLDLAIGFAKRAAELNPQFGPAFTNLGTAWFARSLVCDTPRERIPYLDQAIIHLERAIELGDGQARELVGTARRQRRALESGGR